MTSISALNYVHKTGLFGNYENKNEENLLKVSEIKNLLIVQIVQYKSSTIKFEKKGRSVSLTLLSYMVKIYLPLSVSIK